MTSSSSMSASNALRGRRAELTDILKTRLHDSTAPHYQSADVETLGARCSGVVAAFLESLEGEPTRLASYLRSIARERYDQGVNLTELQLVLHILESSAWKMCDEAIPERDAVIRALGRVSGVIGHGKDALAQVYLGASTASREKLREVHLQLEELVRGTDEPMFVD